MSNFYVGNALEYDNGNLRVVDIVMLDDDSSFQSGDSSQQVYVDETPVDVNYGRSGQGNGYHSTLTGAFIPSRGTFMASLSMVSLTDGRVLFFSGSGFDAATIAANPAGFDFTLPNFSMPNRYVASNPGLALETTTTPPAFLVPDDYAATISTSGSVAAGGSATGEIESAGDVDWFAIDLIAGFTYRIDHEGAGTAMGTLSDPLFEGIFDATGAPIPGTDNDDGGGGLNSQITFAPAETGTYYLAASAFGDSTGSYTLSVDVLALANIITGTASGERLNGTANSDEIAGLGGNDTLRGFAGDDTLEGGAGNDLLTGAAGEDLLRGGANSDRLIGGGRSDTLDGGEGRDILTGSSGADSFYFDDGDFAGLTAATADRIVDFSMAGNDVIDLSPVDARSGGGDNAFVFIGSAGFSGMAGELRYQSYATTTRVFGDTDGDGAADFLIKLDGSMALTQGDFIL